MEVSLFDRIVKLNRRCFRYILDRNLDKVYDDDGNSISFKEWIVKECFRNCTSQFEEQTMIENLKEEFEDFIKEQGE